MSIYEDIAASILPVLPDFTVDSITVWTITRPTQSPFDEWTQTKLGTMELFIVRNEVDKSRMAVPGMELWNALWLGFGPLGQSITPKNGDIISSSDGKRKYRIAGDPQDDFAMWFIPLADYAEPAT